MVSDVDIMVGRNQQAEVELHSAVILWGRAEPARG